MSYAVFSVVFGEQPSAAKWNILGTNDASFNDGTGIGAVLTNSNLSTTAGALGGAWQSWTPTLSGRFNNTKWTKASNYTQVGKTVYFKLLLTANAATPMDGGVATAIFTLPVTSITYQNPTQLGAGVLIDTGTTNFTGYANWASTTTMTVNVGLASGTYLTPNSLTSTIPHTWASTDVIEIVGFYEAA